MRKRVALGFVSGLTAASRCFSALKYPANNTGLDFFSTIQVLRQVVS